MKRFARHPGRIVLVVLLVVGFLTVGTWAMADKPSGASISFVSGDTQVKAGRGGEWKPLKQGQNLVAEDVVKTGAGAKVEIKLTDGSVIRVAPNSEIRMKSLIGGKQKREMNFKLQAGKVWANVSKALGTDEKFEVETKNAVAGVRGTIFRVDSFDDESTLVRVYTGAVAVSNAPIYQKQGSDKGERVQVQGPQPVSRKQWEEMIAKTMQQVRVAANGKMESPEAFADNANDEWVAWNTERDKAAGIKH